MTKSVTDGQRASRQTRLINSWRRQQVLKSPLVTRGQLLRKTVSFFDLAAARFCTQGADAFA
jgi:hypothetical protein